MLEEGEKKAPPMCVGPGRSRRGGTRMMAMVMAAVAAFLLVATAGAPQQRWATLASPSRRSKSNVARSTVSPILPPVMSNATYFFISGMHHSGTTVIDYVLCSHEKVACILHSHACENEGQHLQHVYPSGGQTGGATEFALDERAHITDSSPLVSDKNRLKLFASWARHWFRDSGVDRPIFLEKSPPDILKTRFLQSMFTAKASKFLIMMRHPLGASRKQFVMRYQGKEKRALRKCCMTFCRRVLDNWLTAHRILLEDAPKIKHLRLIRFEHFLEHSAETAKKYLHSVEDFLGIDHSEQVQYEQTGRPRSELRESGAISKYLRALQGAAKHLKHLSPQQEKLLKKIAQRNKQRNQMNHGGASEGSGHSSAKSRDNDDIDPSAKSRDELLRGVTFSDVMAMSRAELQEQFKVEARRNSRSKWLRRRQIRSFEEEEEDRKEEQGFAAQHSHQTARKLLEYHGPRRGGISVHLGTSYTWLDTWFEVFDANPKMCTAMIEEYEPQLLEFGYSLKDLFFIGDSPFEKWVVSIGNEIENDYAPNYNPT